MHRPDTGNKSLKSLKYNPDTGYKLMTPKEDLDVIFLHPILMCRRNIVNESH